MAYGLAGGDFDRQKDQRLIIAALLAKVKGTPTLANPLTLASIFDTLSANVRTDLTIGQVRRVYDLVTRAGDLQGASIKGDKSSLLVDFRSKTLDDVLVPAAGQYDYSATRRTCGPSSTAERPPGRRSAVAISPSSTDAVGQRTCGFGSAYLRVRCRVSTGSVLRFNGFSPANQRVGVGSRRVRSL